MKKRLLALALCLVMMTSLLPLTAAAVEPVTVNSVQIEASGIVKKNFGALYPNVYQLDNATWSWDLEDSEEPDPPEINSFITSNNVISEDLNKHELITNDPVEGETNYVHVMMLLRYGTSVIKCRFADNFSDSSGLTLPGYETRLVGQELIHGLESQSCIIWLTFSLKKQHEHDWQFTVSESGNKLTAKCQRCDIAPASVEIKADSVTLPDSPFNARVVLQGITEEQIKEEFRYEIGPIRYKFKAPGESTFTEITPANGAREGTYQASVTLSPMQIAAHYALNDDGTMNQGLEMAPDGSITLYIQYTAVNPSVTAQTGDNRPIEIMMGSMVVFSALAAAAFILDSKRRSQP